ncbi:MAG: M56 family metallopeptidase [Terriglobales bacterium]
MFAARCIGISLAVFVLLYATASITICLVWKPLWRGVRPQSARRSANLLFAMRLAPLVLAALFTLLFTLPSFLLLEPRSINEPVGTAPLLLGLCCLMLLAGGVFQTVLAQLRTSRALTKWLADSTVVEAGKSVPVFRISTDAPALILAGVRAPRVLVSEAALSVLTPHELRSALEHEVAHVRSYDNLKRLLFRLAVFPGMKGLEGVWSEQAELAADDAAVSSPREALDLAAALIKVSRLRSLQIEFTSALLHSSTALSLRVQRLFSWEQNRSTPASLNLYYVLPPALAAFLLVVGTYGSALTAMHAVTEWLVR